MKNKPEIITSRDGSHTLFLPELNETYHSIHGAVQESEYVFIEKGMDFLKEKSELVILEVGFGTGLNALLAYINSVNSERKVHYHTLEPFPLEEEIFTNLNYADLIEDGKYKNIFLQLHKAPFREAVIIDNFIFHKYKNKLEDWDGGVKADLIFFDAFAPAKQPEVWSPDNFRKIKESMVEDGMLVTYCASGQFKRDLKSLGFKVETLPGPPGKKEMTRAYF